jgi:hypothetical protein
MEPMRAPHVLAEDKIVDGKAPLQTAFWANPVLLEIRPQVSSMSPSGVVIKTISAWGVISQGISLK